MVSENTIDKDFKDVLWASADKLRGTMDAAEYKHVVLGLIFLKYISDSFDFQRKKILKDLTNKNSDYFISEKEEDVLDELEVRDYYTEDSVFWVPSDARWENLRDNAKQPDIGERIDKAMSEIEDENQFLKGKLNKQYGALLLEDRVLGGLVDLISSISFSNDESLDVLGEVYEYFLGKFANEEGKRAGEYFTPRSIVRVLVSILNPNSGRIYDPCCGAGGMFVQSEEFILAHGGKKDDISIFGQESNPTTWKLAAMNLTLRGLTANLGTKNANTFHEDLHKDKKFDFILANPPFNISDWGQELLLDDYRWKYGTPPQGNANYAWLQHIISKLSTNGRAGVVLANGSLTSNTGGEDKIRQKLVEEGLVEAIVAMPANLFFGVTISCSLWFLSKNKTREDEVLFIDAKKLGHMETKVIRNFSNDDIDLIHKTVESWRSNNKFKNITGFCKSVQTKEIKNNKYTLNPGKYVDVDTDSISEDAYEEQLSELTKSIKELSSKNQKLNSNILKIIDEI